MENLVHLLLTRRGPLWRVRILSGGTIRWKCYRAEDYPTPEAVARRCVEGLGFPATMRTNAPTRDKGSTSWTFPIGAFDLPTQPEQHRHQQEQQARHASPLRQSSLEPHDKIKIENFLEKHTKSCECGQPESYEKNQCYGGNEQASHPFLLVRWECWGRLEATDRA